MTKVTAPKAGKSVGLELSPNDMYPPLLSPDADSFVFEIADGESATFDFTLGGQEGPFPGITMAAGPGGGALLLDRQFIAAYSGAWPAQLEVRAWQNGVIVDRRSARLHDTKRMTVASIKQAALKPNPARVLAEGDNQAVAIASAQFFDAAGVNLPNAEVSWQVELPGNPQGLKADGQRVLLLPEAQPGEFAVLFREANGVQSTLTLTLNPTIDTGLKLQAYDLYPPLRHLQPAIITIYHTLPEDSGVTFTYRLNGLENSQPGVLIEEEDLYIDTDFIHSYEGPWPAEVQVCAIVNHQVAGIRTLRLHDTRTMVCTKVDMWFYPSDAMEIPQTGTVIVVPAPQFYDANDIALPHAELTWHAEIVDPMEGVGMIGHLLEISPEAKPGVYRVAMITGELNRARPLRLI
ncbi:hypothetical protein [Stenotrophomonas sp. PD6]|uniref:hypothetical protein n=1 Tax=Stenotrophomonas sp. PD6 TaxID=3368612 RepID=UPI003B9EDBA6